MNLKNNGLLKNLFVIFIFAAVLVLINILISDLPLRFDATQNNIYSLSDATKKVISKDKRKNNL